uniref:procollagen-proline 3-dioxygenase n=1 Tax=Phallusia mammillata TaxID=59560 RepID=A0A6F9DNR2_9ASCI|nr:leprecan protein [Phallusia mammillata]
MCIESCEQKLFGDPKIILRISDDVNDDFKSKEIYKYLQLAYFRNGNFAKSLEVTYSFVIYNPDDSMMQKNMEFYDNHRNSSSYMYINRDAKSHQVFFDKGIEAYNVEEYSKAISLFEQALIEFYKAEEECRAVCEGEFYVGTEYPETPPSFHQQIIAHYRKVLECYMTCPVELARTSIKHVSENYLPKHYHYLQFAYSKVNKHDESIECSKAYLLFHSNNEVMQAHVHQQMNAATISPRQDAVEFHTRLQIQSELLKYVYQNFGIQDYDETLLQPYPKEDVDASEPKENITKTELGNKEEELHEQNNDNEVLQEKVEENSYRSGREKNNDIIDSKDQHNERMEVLRKRREADDFQKKDVDISDLLHKPIGHHTIDSNKILTISDGQSLVQPLAEGPILYDYVTLLANSTQMLGPTRFALDGLASNNECQELIDLELAGGLSGDGYRGRASPHTEHELFEGLTVYRAVELAEQGLLPFRSAQLYYDLSERVRAQVKAYFKLKDELYFDYTHLVCRIAIKGQSTDRDDLSHPVHGDNCLLKEDGTCVKDNPAYTWRDYSSIMYLNDEFDGGEFIMTDATARRVKLQVKPKCGRLVSFCAGKECLHGVKPITRGRRCAMALWFTQDPSHDEQSRIEAKKKLNKLRERDEL